MSELMTPTYLKPRDFGIPGLVGEHSRYDTKNRKPTPSRTERPEHTIQPAKGTEELTPRQTVLSENAQLLTAMTSLDDPDVRLSLWSAECLVCPTQSNGRGKPWFGHHMQPMHVRRMLGHRDALGRCRVWAHCERIARLMHAGTSLPA